MCQLYLAMTLQVNFHYQVEDGNGSD